VSPLAAFGVIIAGLSTSTFGSVGPVFAIKVGLDISQIALFLVFSTFGGLLSQLPAGILADKFSRRSVLLAFSIMATSLCLCMILTASDATIGGIPVIYIMSFLFGFTTFPIYSICAAHASDFVAPDEMLTLSASLIFLYASGAIISPLAAGWIMTKFGAEMMFGFIAAAHFVLMIYTIMRRFARPAEARRSYTYIPRTTLFIAETLKQRLHGRRNK
jgi:MFS family permease